MNNIERIFRFHLKIESFPWAWHRWAIHLV